MKGDGSGVVDVLSGEGELGDYTGPWLTSGQFEVLSRYAISRELGLPLHSVRRGHLQGPSRATRHQIDLFWTSTDGVSEFLCIANAKFMKKRVSLKDLMTLLGVQRTVKAHKAMLITNTGYSAACIAQAREDGVALLVVRPAADFDPGVLPVSGELAVAEVEKALNRRITPAYGVRYVHKAFEVRRGDAGVAVEGSAVGSGGQVPGSVAGGVVMPGGIDGAPARRMGVANKMISSSVPPARGACPFGIRTK